MKKLYPLISGMGKTQSNSIVASLPGEIDRPEIPMDSSEEQFNSDAAEECSSDVYSSKFEDFMDNLRDTIPEELDDFWDKAILFSEDLNEKTDVDSLYDCVEKQIELNKILQGLGACLDDFSKKYLCDLWAEKKLIFMKSVVKSEGEIATQLYNLLHPNNVRMEDGLALFGQIKADTYQKIQDLYNFLANEDHEVKDPDDCIMRNKQYHFVSEILKKSLEGIEIHGEHSRCVEFLESYFRYLWARKKLGFVENSIESESSKKVFRRSCYAGYDTYVHIRKRYLELSSLLHTNSFALRRLYNGVAYDYIRSYDAVFAIVELEDANKMMEFSTPLAEGPGLPYESRGNICLKRAIDINHMMNGSWKELILFDESDGLERYTRYELYDAMRGDAKQAFINLQTAAKKMPRDISSEYWLKQADFRTTMAIALYMHGSLINAKLSICIADNIFNSKVTRAGNESIQANIKEWKNKIESEIIYPGIPEPEEYDSTDGTTLSPKNSTDSSNEGPQRSATTTEDESYEGDGFNQVTNMIINGKEIEKEFKTDLVDLSKQLNCANVSRVLVAEASCPESSIISYENKYNQELKVSERRDAISLSNKTVGQFIGGVGAAAGGAFLGATTASTLAAGTSTAASYVIGASAATTTGTAITTYVGSATIFGVLGVASGAFVGLCAIGYLSYSVTQWYMADGNLDKKHERALNLNSIIEEALACYRREDYIGFLTALSKEYGGIKPLIDFQSGASGPKSIEVDIQVFINELLGYEFSPDGIAYISYLFADTLLQVQQKFSDRGKVAGRLAGEILRSIEEQSSNVLVAKSSEIEKKTLDLDEASQSKYLSQVIEKTVSVRLYELQQLALIRLIENADKSIQTELINSCLSDFKTIQEKLKLVDELNVKADLIEYFIGIVLPNKESQELANNNDQSVEENYSDLQQNPGIFHKFCKEAEVAVKEGRHEESIKLWSVAEMKFTEVCETLKKADDAVREGKYEEGINLFRTADPKLAVSYESVRKENLSNKDDGNDGDALSKFNVSYENAKREALFGVVYCRLGMNKHEEALSYLKEMCKEYNGWAEFWYLNAECTIRIDKYSSSKFSNARAFSLKCSGKSSNYIRKKLIDQKRHIDVFWKGREERLSKGEGIHHTSIRKGKETTSITLLSADSSGAQALQDMVVMCEVERFANKSGAALFDFSSLAGASAIMTGMFVPVENSGFCTVPKYRADEMLKICTESFHDIFIKDIASQEKSSSKKLKYFLAELLGDATLDQTLNTVIMPALGGKSHSSPLWFHSKSDEKYNGVSFLKLKLKHTIRAAMSEPTFFGPFIFPKEYRNSSVSYGNCNISPFHCSVIGGDAVASNPLEYGIKLIKDLGWLHDDKEIIYLSLGSREYSYNLNNNLDGSFWPKYEDELNSVKEENRYRVQAFYGDRIKLHDYSAEISERLISDAYDMIDRNEINGTANRLSAFVEKVVSNSYSFIGRGVAKESDPTMNFRDIHLFVGKLPEGYDITLIKGVLEKGKSVLRLSFTTLARKIISFIHRNVKYQIKLAEDIEKSLASANFNLDGEKFSKYQKVFYKRDKIEKDIFKFLNRPKVKRELDKNYNYVAEISLIDAIEHKANNALKVLIMKGKSHLAQNLEEIMDGYIKSIEEMKMFLNSDEVQEQYLIYCAKKTDINILKLGAKAIGRKLYVWAFNGYFSDEKYENYQLEIADYDKDSMRSESIHIVRDANNVLLPFYPIEDECLEENSPRVG